MAKEGRFRKAVLFFLVVVFLFCFYSLGLTATDRDYAAEMFAEQYSHELKQAEEEEAPEAMERAAAQEGPVSPGLTVDAAVRAAVAEYKEKEQGIESSFRAFYPELWLSAIYRTQNDFFGSLEGSFGRTLTEEEDWKSNGTYVHSNDLNFYFGTFRAQAGKGVIVQMLGDLHLAPFLGYGFNYMKFERSNNNVIGAFSRNVANESYYTHHADAGLKLDKKFGEKFFVSASGLYGYVFYNEADNGNLGWIKGKGELITEANVNLKYFLTKQLKLLLGGFFDYQKLKGNTKDDVLWPNNELYVYGGQAGIELSY